MGAYFGFCAYRLALGDPRPLLRLWPLILALGAPLLAAVLVALLKEPNQGAVAQFAGLWLLCVVCSCIGARFGWHAKHA
jgi:hypothetical protein